uniref:DM10 domain-containing protein n=1 Tax=Salmo trutta TaxID=8032 RepID=A0A673XDV9_SALTR
MELPMLPGNSLIKNVRFTNSTSPSNLTVPKGVPMMVGSGKPGIEGELLLGKKAQPNYSCLPQRRGAYTLWLIALSFEAYFWEAVPQKARGESYGLPTACKICFYLEDNAIKVVDSEFKNSGTRRQLSGRTKLAKPDLKSYNTHVKRVRSSHFLVELCVCVLVCVFNSDSSPSVGFLLCSLLQHAPIPKRQPGEITDRRVLNMFGPMGQAGCYILDTLKVRCC